MIPLSEYDVGVLPQDKLQILDGFYAEFSKFVIQRLFALTGGRNEEMIQYFVTIFPEYKRDRDHQEVVESWFEGLLKGSNNVIIWSDNNDNTLLEPVEQPDKRMFGPKIDTIKIPYKLVYKPEEEKPCEFYTYLRCLRDLIEARLQAREAHWRLQALIEALAKL